MMRCDETLRLLDDYLDGVLPAELTAAVGAHLGACPGCRGDEARTLRLLAAAAELPAQIAPVRDLWPEIAAQIRTEDNVASIPGGGTRAPWRRAVALAAAAVVLVAVTAALTARWVSQRAQVVAFTPDSRVVTAAMGDTALGPALADYQHAAEALRAALAQQRGSVSPATLQVVDDNLRIIDGAIDHLQQALVASPGDRDLALMLASTYRRQIDLLKTANDLARI